MRMLETYERLIKGLRSRQGIIVGLLESVANPELRNRESSSGFDSSLRSEYRDDIRQFAKRMHVPYWDLNREAALRPFDFVDYIHVRTAKARDRFTEALAAHAAVVFTALEREKAGTQ